MLGCKKYLAFVKKSRKEKFSTFLFQFFSVSLYFWAICGFLSCTEEFCSRKLLVPFLEFLGQNLFVGLCNVFYKDNFLIKEINNIREEYYLRSFQYKAYQRILNRNNDFYCQFDEIERL